MTAAADRARAHAMVDDLLGPPDQAADRAVAVLHAHAAALAWVRDTTGSYPAPASVAAQLESAAERLRTGSDERDPVAVLGPRPQWTRWPSTGRPPRRDRLRPRRPGADRRPGRCRQ